MGTIAENLAEVEARVDAACERAGRSREEVTLIAVSKTKPLDQVMDLLENGVRDFGENKVQELCGKAGILEGTETLAANEHVPRGEQQSFEVSEDIAKEIHWHLIGHLQRNKVKYIVGRSYLIHSVDSEKLAAEIEKEAVKKGIESVDVLIEVNIGNEETKTGVAFCDAKDLVRAVSKLPHVHVKGLMCIAPFVENAEDNRECFKRMKRLSDELAAEHIPGVEMKELSMGMTGDFEVAVEEGATMVRVGTAIFGARNYDI